MALTTAQQAAQDWINKSNSGQGGTDAYIKSQQAKQQAAQASGDTAMLAKLQADAARTGLSYAPANGMVGIASVPAPTPFDAASAFKSGADQYKATGSFNSNTPTQNLAAVANQPGNTSGAVATPYVTPSGTTDYHITGGSYTPPPTPSLTPNPTPTPAPTPSNNVGTAAPTAMTKAMQALPTYVPPTSTGLNFDQATSQVKGQLDPMFQQALVALNAQKYQDQLDGDQLGMARGGSHSGLAADLQNKVAIGAAGKAADLDATRQTQTAQMAQDLVTQGQQYDLQKQQQALAEYLGINGLNLQQQGQQADYTGLYNGQQTLQSQNQSFNQGAQTADLTGWYQGLQTLAGQQQSYNQSPTNPTNQGQVLQNQGTTMQNQLTQLQLNDYPAQSQAAAQKTQQDLATGKITQDTAKYQLDQLKDPNSPTNQAAKLDLQMKQIDASTYSQENQLKLKELQKTVADIGVVHTQPQSAADIAADQVKLATATKQLADIQKGIYPGDKQTPTPVVKPITSEDYQANIKPQYDPHGKLTNADQIEDQIILSGMSDYEQYKSYVANGIKDRWDDPIPQKPS